MSDNKEDMDFDSLIRGRYQDHSMPVSNDLWDGINAGLNQKRLFNSQSKIRILQVVSAVSVASMIAMFFYFNAKISDLESQNTVSANSTALTVQDERASNFADKTLAVSDSALMAEMVDDKAMKQSFAVTEANSKTVYRNLLEKEKNNHSGKGGESIAFGNTDYTSAINGKKEKVHQELHGLTEEKELDKHDKLAENTVTEHQSDEFVTDENNDDANKTVSSNSISSNTNASAISSEKTALKDADNQRAYGNSSVASEAQQEISVGNNFSNNDLKVQTESVNSFYNSNDEEQPLTATDDVKDVTDTEQSKDNIINGQPETEIGTEQNNAVVAENLGNSVDEKQADEESVAESEEILAEATVETEEHSKTSALVALLKNAENTPFYLEAFYAPGVSNRFVASSSQEGLDKNKLAETERFAFANSAGLCISTQAMPKMRIKTGVVFSQYNLRVAQTDTLGLTKSGDNYYAPASAGAVPVTVNFTKTDYYQTDTIEVVVENKNTDSDNDEEIGQNDGDDDEDDEEPSQEVKNPETHIEKIAVVNKTTVTEAEIEPTKVTFSYISIPLELQYQFAKHFSLNLGILAQFQIKNNIYHSTSPTENLMPSSELSKVSLAVSVGAEYEQPISKSLALFVNPTFSSFITPVSKDYPVKTYLNSCNARTGIRLKL